MQFTSADGGSTWTGDGGTSWTATAGASGPSTRCAEVARGPGQRPEVGHAGVVDQPDIIGGGPALRPGVPLDEQVRAGAERRRRRMLTAGSLALLGAATLLASRADRDPADPAPRAVPTPTLSEPATRPPATAGGSLLAVGAGQDRTHALVATCAGPEQARVCTATLLTRSRGGPWRRHPVPGFGGRLSLLTSGTDTVSLVDDVLRVAYVATGEGPLVFRRIRPGPPIAEIPPGLAPEILDGAVGAFDPATGLRRRLSIQPRLDSPLRDVTIGPFGDLWAAGEAVVAHSPDRGRSWRTTSVSGLRPGLAVLELVASRDGGAYLIGWDDRRTRSVRVWRAQPMVSETWTRLDPGDGPRSIGSAVAGRNGLLVSETDGGVWRISTDGPARRLPEPQVDGVPVPAGPVLVAGPDGTLLSPVIGAQGQPLLLVSADDGESWLATGVPA